LSPNIHRVHQVVRRSGGQTLLRENGYGTMKSFLSVKFLWSGHILLSSPRVRQLRHRVADRSPDRWCQNSFAWTKTSQGKSHLRGELCARNACGVYVEDENHQGQIIAGCPALGLRGFLRRYRLAAFVAKAAKEELELGPAEDVTFLREMVPLGYLEPMNPPLPDGTPCFEVTSLGQAFANASGARPISRETADRVLQEFMERVQVVNASNEYVYKSESVVLFGSMLTDLDRLGMWI
jgi:hypothetical protein